jgi:glycosyltransferase involved in cell wall biosynthesis
MKKILFYFDGIFFGGHEIMTLAAINCLLAHEDVLLYFICHEKNKKLRKELELLNKTKHRIAVYTVKPRLLQLRDHLKVFPLRNEIAGIEPIMKNIAPDIVVVIQGRIEISVLGLIAARKARYRTISYIPMAHSLVSLLNKGQASRGRDIKDLLYAKILDIIYRFYLYKLPDKFITITRDMKEKLISNGVTAPIDVVYNGIDLSRLRTFDKWEARDKYGLKKEEYLVALAGRISFAQKGHVFLIEAISESRSLLADTRFLIVGEGPDKDLLEKMIAEKDLAEYVKLIPWHDDLSEMYSASDMMIIPSRYEGMPLVMLEAMYYGLPVIATNVDGMAELLPPEWLFEYGDRDGLINTLLKVKASDNTLQSNMNRQLVIDKFNLRQFGDNFLRSVVR